MVPLRGVVEESGMVSIFAGRHRRKIAIELGLAEIPIVTNNGVRLLDFVIEEAVTGRQLTKSGVALVLFEKHPALAKGAWRRKGSLDKANAANGNHAKNGDGGRSAATIDDSGEDSFRVLAERYGVPRDYFVLLAAIRYGRKGAAHRIAAASKAQWTEVKRAIIEDGVAITRLFAGYQGGDATRGKHRSDPCYLMLDRNGGLQGLMPEALTSLENGFKAWRKLNLEARAKLRERWHEVLDGLPEDLQ